MASMAAPRRRRFSGGPNKHHGPKDPEGDHSGPGAALAQIDAAADSGRNSAGRERAIRRGIGARVLVLNATFEPINVCTVRRAVVLVLKEKAEVIDVNDWEMHSENMTMTQPTVIRLTSYVRIPYNRNGRRITRRAVFARDGWSCQYCGRNETLTVDHVIPKSKGGTTSWDNVVTSCAPCNRRKGDRLPKQADMHPKVTPTAPSTSIFVHVASPIIPTSWQPYVSAAAA